MRNHPFLRHLVLQMFMVAAAFAGVCAGEPAPQAGPAKSTNLVTVDFKALSDSGAPILDLKPADVSLKVGGRVREIRALDLVKLAGAQTAADGSLVPALPPAFASNHLSDSGRTVFIVLEDDSIQAGREQTVRDAVDGLLEGLSGRDRVGLLLVSHGTFDTALTTRHEAIRAVLSKFVGRAMRSETGEDAACRTLQAIGAVKGVISSLTGGTPSTILFLSGGLAPPTLDSSTMRRTGSAASATSGSTACEVRRELFEEVTAEANRASVDLYVAQIPADMQVSTSSNSDIMAGLENMAGVTGNALIRISGNVKRDISRVITQTSAYYLATFETDVTDQPGAASRVELRVSRDNARVRARSEIKIAKSGGSSGGSQTAKDLLRVATTFNDVSIRAVAQTARGGSDSELKLVVMFEPHDPSLAFSSAAVGLFDPKGKLVAQWTSQPADLTSLPVMAAILTKPGTYRMRVAVTDVFGQSGTVDQELRAELEAGAPPVQLSTLVLGAPFNGAFGPKLQFRMETSALGYFEVYGAPTGAKVTAIVEVAASSAGPASASVPARVGTPMKDGRRVVLGEIPIGTLRPGEHVIRFIVNVDDKPAGRVVRTLRKVAQ